MSFCGSRSWAGKLANVGSQARCVGDDVERGSRLALAGRYDRGGHRVAIARDEALYRDDELRGDEHGIHRQVRAGGVAALARHDDLELDRKSTRLNSSH